MKKPALIILILFSFYPGGSSQQLPLLDNYLINPASLSPAFTGKYNLFEAYITYRNEWINIPGSPLTGALNLDAMVNKNIGLGGNIQLTKAGILTNFTANFNFAYHIQVARQHFLSFAINVVLYQNSINLTELIVSNPQDPMLNGRDNITETFPNVGTSILYSWRDLNVCIAFPLLFNNRSFYSNSTYDHVMALDRNWLFYANYSVGVNPAWKLKFDLLIRNSQYTPWNYELSTMVTYNDAYWFGLFYRRNNIIGITAGLSILNAMVINYNYEFSGSSMTGRSGGTHEISLGYTLKKKKKVVSLKDYNY